MTTVDVRIERLGSGDRLLSHNGMWEPATSVLHALGLACQDGRIPTSKWNVAADRRGHDRCRRASGSGRHYGLGLAAVPGRI